MLASRAARLLNPQPVVAAHFPTNTFIGATHEASSAGSSLGIKSVGLVRGLDEEGTSVTDGHDSDWEPRSNAVLGAIKPFFSDEPLRGFEPGCRRRAR